MSGIHQKTTPEMLFTGDASVWIYPYFFICLGY